MKLIRIHLIFPAFVLCLFLVLSLFSPFPVSADTSLYRSAGWVSTGWYANTDGCQKTDGIYCAQPGGKGWKELFFGAFGNLDDFGIPYGSTINALRFKVTGHSDTTQYVGLDDAYRGYDSNHTCSVPANWQFNFNATTDSIVERVTPASGTGAVNCITPQNIDQENLTFQLSANAYYGIDWWTAYIDNFEIAFDYTPPTANYAEPSAQEFNDTVWQWENLSDHATKIPGLAHVAAVAKGVNHSLALKNDGTVWSWGSNSRGQLGIGSETIGQTITEPVQVKGTGGEGFLTDAKAIAAGSEYSMALKNDGTVWMWGINSGGVRGTGSGLTDPTNNLVYPEEVKGENGTGYLTGISAITAGVDHTLALKEDGHVWGWGFNNWGQLGYSCYYSPPYMPPNPDCQLTKYPREVANMTNVKEISAGQWYSLGLKDDGTIWTWGNYHAENKYPVKLTEFSNIKHLASNTRYSIFINTANQVLDQTTHLISELDTSTQISSGNSIGAALEDNGTVYQWWPLNINPVKIKNLSQVSAISAGNPSLAVVGNASLPEACHVTTSPEALSLSVGKTATVSASVTSGLGSATVTSMRFGSYNTSLATVDPIEDTSSSYEATITGVASGNTAIWATADLSDGRTCQSATDTDTDITVTPAPKLPVILIPGFMGSEFAVKEANFNPGIANCLNLPYSYPQGDTVWLNQNFIANLDIAICGKYLDVLQIDPSGVSTYPQIELKDVIITKALDKQFAYYDIMSYFQNTKHYSLDKDFFIFPYGWRKDIKDNILALNNKINTATESAGTTKVQIVAHSMGGLIARDYIRDPDRAKKVDALVELGTPHLGAPSALAHLLYEKCVKWINIPILEIPTICAINTGEFKKLVQNFPGGFELLPSKKYYDLYPALYPFNEERDIDSDGTIKGSLSYTQLRALLANLGKHMSLFDEAETYHDSLDPTYTNTNGVKTYLIAGTGQPTIGQIRDYNGLSLTYPLTGLPQLTIGPKQDAIATDGDDTVPLLSATLGQQTGVYYVNQTHSELPTGQALEMTYRLLQGETATIDGVSTTPQHTINGQIIGVYSPALLHAYDSQGNHTGPKDNDTIEIGIPGSSYDTLGESKFIYLPNGGQYNIKTKATAKGSFDLKIKTYTNSTLSKEQLYLTVPQITEQTTTSLDLANENTALQIDNDNNGTVDQTASSSSTITGNDLADTQAPNTSVQIDGTQGTNNWFTSNVFLSFTADDPGAGVLKTYYYKDGEQTLHEAAQGVTIDKEGTTKLWYFSIDKAGNTEEPKSITIKIDKTNPTLSYAGRTESNTNGWNKTDVTVNWTCEDSVSGLVDHSISQTITTEGQNQSVSGKCQDKAGNTSEDTQNGISIDKTDPIISITAPQDKSTYLLKSVINAEWSSTDTLSGMDTSTSTIPTGNPIDTSKVGSYNFTITATDKAGNTQTQMITYKVIYRFDGFLQPINDTGHTQTCGDNCTISIFKTGSTIPVKFQLKDASGNLVQSDSLPQWIIPQQKTSFIETINETDFTDPTDSGATYNWDGDKYHYNWKTKDLPAGYYWLIGVKLGDGQTYTVKVGLR